MVSKNEKRWLYTKSIQLLNGFGAGMIATVILNPYDKALYLSVIEKRSFLDSKNFRYPYQGVGQTLFQRTISHGLYFPLESLYHEFASNIIFNNTNKNELKRSKHIIAGTLAGATNALILNPLSAIKYTRFGEIENISMKKEFISMYKQGGLKQFGKGMYATMIRDIIFGSIFSVLRHGYRDKYKRDRDILSFKMRLYIDMSSAFVATMISSPFNYIRNIQYNTPKDASKIYSFIKILRKLYWEGINSGKPIALWQQRLRIGWGTTRVALGMGFVSFVFEISNEYILNINEE